MNSSPFSPSGDILSQVPFTKALPEIGRYHDFDNDGNPKMEIIPNGDTIAFLKMNELHTENPGTVAAIWGI